MSMFFYSFLQNIYIAGIWAFIRYLHKSITFWMYNTSSGKFFSAFGKLFILAGGTIKKGHPDKYLSFYPKMNVLIFFMKM